MTFRVVKLKVEDEENSLFIVLGILFSSVTSAGVQVGSKTHQWPLGRIVIQVEIIQPKCARSLHTRVM